MRKPALLLVIGLLSAGLVAAPGPSAQAADIQYAFAANTGGTYVTVFDGTVNSDFTAQSYVNGGPASEFSKNSTASAEVEGLLRVGAVETRTRGIVGDTNTALYSFARTANVQLLGGLITADAVETTIKTVARANGTSTSTGSTTFVDLKIAGVDLPVTIPKNYSVTIPGIANISLNYHATGQDGHNIATTGWAIGVSLIKPRNGYAAGVTAIVNPVNQYFAEAVPAEGALLSGGAFSTSVQANAGDRIRIISDRTAYVGTPYGSSGGKTLSNTTLGVNVPGVLTTGEIRSTSWSTKDTLESGEIRNTNEIAHLDILGGLITADAIKVVAYGKYQDGVWTHRQHMTTVNLVVAGKAIPINIRPNTVIDVAGLGSVSLNQQVVEGSGGVRANGIYGLRIVLDTSRAGLPIGAVIEVAVAAAQIVPKS